MVKHSFFSASRTFSFGRRYTSWLLCPNFQSKSVAKPGLGHSPQRQWILSYYNNFLIEDSPDPQLPDFVASHPFSNPIGSSLFGNFLCNIVVLKGDPGWSPLIPSAGTLGPACLPSQSSLHLSRSEEAGLGKWTTQRAGSWYSFSFRKCLDFLWHVGQRQPEPEVPLTTWWLHFQNQTWESG